MIYISAGHNNSDPGAIGVNGVKEADLTKELRDLICHELQILGASFITDKDSESLGQYIKRIKPGSGSVVFDIHFNASQSGLATGTEVLVSNNARIIERGYATKIANATVNACNLFNRGVKTEKQSHRGSLAMLNTKAGISMLWEVCFLDNAKDLQLYHRNKAFLANRIAQVLQAADKAFG